MNIQKNIRLSILPIFGLGLVAVLAGCSRESIPPLPGAGGFPTDAQIHAALQQQFTQDPSHAPARQLVHTLAGEKGELRYQVRHVIYRQGAFEARYDAALHLGQPGAQSLQALYATMVPPGTRSQLPAQDLASYEAWLQQHARTLEKTDAAQARALRTTLEVLGRCYRDAPAGSDVVVMQGLAALLSPERGGGLFAEKLASDSTVLTCLPA